MSNAAEWDYKRHLMHDPRALRLPLLHARRAWRLLRVRARARGVRSRLHLLHDHAQAGQAALRSARPLQQLPKQQRLQGYMEAWVRARGVVEQGAPAA